MGWWIRNNRRVKMPGPMAEIRIGLPTLQPIGLRHDIYSTESSRLVSRSKVRFCDHLVWSLREVLRAAGQQYL